MDQFDNVCWMNGVVFGLGYVLYYLFVVMIGQNDCFVVGYMVGNCDDFFLCVLYFGQVYWFYCIYFVVDVGCGVG